MTALVIISIVVCGLLVVFNTITAIGADEDVARLNAIVTTIGICIVIVVLSLVLGIGM